jgi:Rnl2 family RNA ligase
MTSVDVPVDGATDAPSPGPSSAAPKFAFHPYDSMTNKVRNWASEQNESVAWVATPKIHGTNMSVTILRNTGEVKYARRNAFLGSDTAFMGYGAVLPGLTTWTDFLEDFPDAVQAVTIFGEFFGGSWPGTEDHPIQRGVHYSPSKRFVAFDIRLSPGGFVDFPVMAAACRRHGVPHVQVAAQGSFDDMAAWARTHAADDVDPALYEVTDLPVIPGNAGEGWVIRPLVELHSTEKGRRVLVKIKNAAFSESARASGRGPKPLPGTFTRVTATRVANVLSKELPETLTFARFRALVDLVLADIAADEVDVDADADPAEDPALTAKATGALVREYLQDFAKRRL